MKDCLLTTYVAGKKYQAFIPLLVYSCKKAYPEYDIMLFLHEKLDPDIENCLKKLGLLDQLQVKERYLYNKNQESLPSVVAGSRRWVLWDKDFLNYKYLYIVDIDIFYIREPKPLHIQHEEHMQITGLPFDNVRRMVVMPVNLRSILRRLKYAGFANIFDFIKSKNIVENQLSGLHFIDIHRYYTPQTIEYLKQIEMRLQKRIYFPEILTSNEEALLYKINEELGYDLTSLGSQNPDSDILDFNNNTRLDFRPHHGLHLGIFKSHYFEQMPKMQQESLRKTLDSSAYMYYIAKYKELIATEEFKMVYSSLPPITKLYLDRMHDYYRINDI